LRGGQNLTERWRRLERSLRGKEAYGAQRDALVDQAEDASGVDHLGAAGEVSSSGVMSKGTGEGKGKGKGPRTFRGLVLPEAPKEPQSDECCMSGCAICVYDLYEAAREDYKLAVEALRSTLDTLGIPESEWPAEVRRADAGAGAQGGGGSSQKTKPQSTREVVESAFEAFERALREKRERESVQAGSG